MIIANPNHHLQVVLNTAPLGDEEVEIRPHSLSIHSYKTPTFCRFESSPQKCLFLGHYTYPCHSFIHSFIDSLIH